MAKKPRKSRKVVKGTARIVAVSGEITVNGIRHEIPPVNYSRIEYSDGTVKESGADTLGPFAEMIRKAFSGD